MNSRHYEWPMDRNRSDEGTEEMCFIVDCGQCGCTDEDAVLPVFHKLLLYAESDDKNLAAIIEEIGGDTIFYLGMAALEQGDFIEHGIAIRFPWPTERGKAALEWLNNRGQ